MSDPKAQTPKSDEASARVVEHTVGEDDAGERADVVLGRRIPALSRRQARALARGGKLRVDGRRRPPSTRVDVGTELSLELDDAEQLPEALQTRLDTLEPLAETEHFIYVAKPAGVHTVALTPAQPGVLATVVAERWPECAEASPDLREGGAVHRLDQATSGVVAFARSREAWEQARAGFSDERVAKHYLAVCERSGEDWPPALPEGGLRGWIEDAEAPTGFEAELAELRSRGQPLDLPASRVRAALGRDHDRRRCAVRLDGRRASTVVSPLAAAGPRWLVRLLLETGRRHQARVHLAWIGLAIVGDTLYGTASSASATKSEGARAIRLHAFAIDLSAVFASEAPVYSPPAEHFWPA